MTEAVYPDLKGKTALVCASSSGLGKATALELARQGVNVVLCSRDAAKLERAKVEIGKCAKGEVLAVPADLSSGKDIDVLFNRVIQTFKTVHILINNTGGPSSGVFSDFKEEDWTLAYEALLLSNIRLCQKVLPYMRKQKFGRIINITSTTVKEPAPTLILSNVFRSAIVSLAKTMSFEFAKDNVLINNVCPASFLTERTEALMRSSAERDGKTFDEVKKNIEKGIPLGQFQEPARLADLICFLSSERAAAITGVTLNVDAGNSKAIF